MKRAVLNCNPEEGERPVENYSPLEFRRNIFRKDSHIYFYDAIDDETHLIFNKMFEDAIDYLSQKYDKILPFTNGNIPETIVLHINSPGGLVVDSLAIYDMIKTSEFPVIGVVEGIAASGASLLLCGCHYRLMTENSLVMIHELRSGFYGKFSEIKDEMCNNSTLMNIIKKIYLKETKIPEKEIDEALLHDIYWDSEVSITKGIVNSIVGHEAEPIEEKKKEPRKKKEPAKKKSEPVKNVQRRRQSKNKEVK